MSGYWNKGPANGGAYRRVTPTDYLSGGGKKRMSDDRPGGGRRLGIPAADDLWRRGPETVGQALMEAAPGHEPARSAEERQADPNDHVQAVRDALSTLTERQQLIAEAVLMRGLTVRECAREIGWSHPTVVAELKIIRPLLAEALAHLLP